MCELQGGSRNSTAPGKTPGSVRTSFPAGWIQYSSWIAHPGCGVRVEAVCVALGKERLYFCPIFSPTCVFPNVSSLSRRAVLLPPSPRPIYIRGDVAGVFALEEISPSEPKRKQTCRRKHSFLLLPGRREAWRVIGNDHLGRTGSLGR